MSATNGTPLIQVRDLVKHFPITKGIIIQHKVGAVQAVDGVSFDVVKGETLGLVGETGCGKSTTARLLMRLLDPTSGQVLFDGEDIAERKGDGLKALHREMQITADPRLESLYNELAGYPGVEIASPLAQVEAPQIVLPLRLRDGDRELAFFSTISTFGTAVDITLAELSIEAFYPANARTANRLLRDIDVGATPQPGSGAVGGG